MTSSEGAGQDAGQAGRSPGSGLSPDAAAAAATPESADGQAAVPLDAQQLMREIEQTRERLGRTVAELATRVDVRSRARAVTKGASSAREHWVPLTVAVGALVVGGLTLWLWRRH